MFSLNTNCCNYPKDYHCSSLLSGSVNSTDSAFSSDTHSGKMDSKPISHAISCDSTDSGHASISEVPKWESSQFALTISDTFSWIACDRRSYPPPQADPFAMPPRRHCNGGMMQMMGHHRPNPYFMSAHAVPRKSRAPPPPTVNMPAVQFVPGVGKYVNVQQAARRRNSAANGMGVIPENGERLLNWDIR